MSAISAGARPGRLGRYVLQLPVLCWLVLVWVLLHGAVTVQVVVSGVVVAALILVVFRMPAMDYGLRLRPVAAAHFVVRFLFDLVVASLWMVVQTLGPRPSCSVLAVPLRTRSDVLLTATAITVSATPGSIVVEVDRATSTLWIHALGAVDHASIAAARDSTLALERRLARAFGTHADIDRVHAPEGQP